MSRHVEAAMGSERRWHALSRLSPLACVLTLGACATVLGIEDVHEGPAPGDGGDTGTGATSSTGGKNSTGGDNSMGASAPMGGDDTGVGGTPVIEGGTGNEAGSAMGGAPPVGDPTVRGHLIDYWGHDLANIPVQIGETLTSTDEDGEFVIENVSDTYEVSLHVEFPQYGGHRSFGWVFQGLTRRDPTLQVSWGLPVTSGNVLLTPQNLTLDTNESISVAIGGIDGNTTFSEVGTNGLNSSASWEGGSSSQATAHGICFQSDPATELPTSYLSYDDTLVALSETNDAQIALDLTKGTLDAGNVQVTVTPASDVDRGNYAFLRFDSGATIPLVDDYPGPNTATYLLPSIPKSTITVAAYEGDAYYGEYAVVHADGLATTAKPALKIPTPATLTAPADEIKGVNGTTNFAFQSPASNPGPFVVQFENVDLNGPYQTLYVVTAAKQLQIPVVIGGGFALQANNLIAWRVATHGAFASVDEMTGPSGFIDPFAVDDEPAGPHIGSGEYTISYSRLFTTAE